MRSIWYFGNYEAEKEGCSERFCSLAAVNKMDYIISTAEKLGYQVNIVSSAVKKSPLHFFESQKKEAVSEKVLIIYAPSMKRNNKLIRYFHNILVNVWVFNKLMFLVKKKDPVVVYNRVAYSFPVRLVKKLRKLNVILEIEEINSKVWPLKKRQVIAENKLLKSAGEKVLIVSDVLKEYLENKEGIVVYGNYIKCFPEKTYNKNTQSIQMIYSGTIDKHKGSAFVALDVLEKLPDHYTLNITGPIDKENKDEFLKIVERINSGPNKKKCIYHGILPKKEFDDLLYQCDIALNLQQEGEFGSFVFPSKILNYLCHGLNVVTTPGESIVRSKLNDILTISESYSEESIIDSILNP